MELASKMDKRSRRGGAPDQFGTGSLPVTMSLPLLRSNRADFPESQGRRVLVRNQRTLRSNISITSELFKLQEKKNKTKKWDAGFGSGTLCLGRKDERKKKQISTKQEFVEMKFSTY